MVKSGTIWGQAPRVRAQRVRRVCEALSREYGEPRLGNPEDPVDDLVYIMVSNKTSPDMAHRVWAGIRARFPEWDDLLRARRPTLERLLAPAGLASVKSQQMRGALRQIVSDFGRCDLTALRGEPDELVETYLISLPGVSLKVAKCVMLYTMGRGVLPVDAHVLRVARRLGWTARKRADQCHAELEALVPPKRRYTFHVGCILHGRAVCRPRDPRCAECVLQRHCDFARRTRHETKQTPDRG